MKLLTWVLDLLYPPRCILCRRILDSSESVLCPACADQLPDYTDPAPKVRFTSGGAVTFFYEDKLRESFLRFKFGGLDFYASTYGAWLATTVRARLSGTFDAVTWVPVSRIRKFRRGYDQSELLCRSLARQLGMEPERLLRKRLHTPPQSSLAHAEERRANVSNAFLAVHPERITGRRILLIDDVVTTGSTLSECARVLRMAGAADVVFAAFASPRKTQTKEDQHGNQTDS